MATKIKLPKRTQVLDGETPLKRVRLQNAEPLTFQVGRVAIQAAFGAFAAILGDGSVVTWGRASVVRELKNVQQIQATSSAFAAILVDGSVETWGLAKLRW